MAKCWKKSLNGHATVVGWSRDRRLTVKLFYVDVSAKMAKFKKKLLNGRQWLEVTRLSTDCQTTFSRRFNQNGKIWRKSRRTVTRQSTEVTRPSADCQTTLFRRYSKNGKILKKVAERSRNSRRRSRDRRLTVKQPYFDVTAKMAKFLKKSLNGHATVDGGHAIVNRLSNNFFSTFQPKWQTFEKSRWTVRRQSSEVTRPSADCQTTLFRRYSKNGKIFKKVTERSRDSRRRSHDRRLTVNQLYFDIAAKMARFLKSRWKVTWQSSEITRPLADYQTTFFDVSTKMAKCWKKSLNGHATVVGWSRDRRLTVKLFYVDVSAKMAKFKKSCWTVDSGWRSRDRWPTIKQPFLDVSIKMAKFWKKSPDGQATVDGGHATVGWLLNNIISTLQQKWQNFDKSRWTVTQQSTEITQPSAECQTTLFWRFSKNGKILKKVAERSRDSRRKSRDRRLTVKQPYFDVTAKLAKFWRKSLNGHATVVGGHATVGWLSINFISTCQQKWQNF